MRELLRKIRSTGRIAEPAPERVGDGDAVLRGSVQVRHVDAGSCNGCEVEIGSVFGPVYDGERYGARLVASPRHADVLLVTGPVKSKGAAPADRTPRMVAAHSAMDRRLALAVLAPDGARQGAPMVKL